MMVKIVCMTCGSDEVYVQQWIHENTDKSYNGPINKLRETNNWCDTCKKYQITGSINSYKRKKGIK